MTLKPAGEANSVTAKPDSLKQAAVCRATDVYVSIRKRLWQDLHPRVYINIRNPDLSYLVNNTAFNFWTRVAQRNAAFDAIYAGSPTPASGGGTAQPRQLASPAATAGPHPEAQLMAAPHSGAAIQERLAAINADSLDALISKASRYGVAILEDILPDAKREIALRDFATIKEVPATPMGSGVRCYSRKPSASFREIFDELTLTVTKTLYGIGYHPPKDRFGFVQRLEFETEDRNDPNTILHIDRHIPSIKLFYYPHPISSPDLSPFGYIPESHIINQNYINEVRSTFQRRTYGSKPFAMHNPTGNPELPILVKGNSLVLTYTNGLHRRTPFGGSALPGATREAACFMFYNLHTRLKLLSQVL